MPAKPRVVIAGLVARFPLGGVACDYLQYVAGFQRLGCEVFYLEDSGEWCYNPVEQTFTEDCAWNAEWLGRACARFGIPAGAWCLRNWDGRCHGVSHERLLEVIRSADLFVNVSGTCWLREEYRQSRMKKVFIDSDPGYNQTWIAQAERISARCGTHGHREPSDGCTDREKALAERDAGRPFTDDEKKLVEAVARIRAHDAHFTFAENVGGADEKMPPTPGIAWRATRQPVVLDLFEPAPPASARPLFTTVMSWKAHAFELEWEGRKYGGKAASFEPYFGLPARFGRRFEVAVAGKAPLERLRAAGFEIADPAAASGDVDRYLAYLAGSRGEWSVAKEVYAAMRTGWFSCRTACYLALGRPAIVEDTGFRALYPLGRGLFAFSSEDEVGAALEAIDRDHPAACRAAREVAEECFDARKVLRAIVEVA